MDNKQMLELVTEAKEYKIKNNWTRNAGQDFTLEEIQEIGCDNVYPDHANIFYMRIDNGQENNIRQVILKNSFCYSVNLEETETMEEFLINAVEQQEAEEERE